MENEPIPSLENANIAIIGLGLMGGSIALAMQEKCGPIKALDIHEATIQYATDKGMVEIAGSEPQVILSDADIVILACPVPAILQWLTLLPKFITHSCIVMDIGSSKRKIIERMSLLPRNFEPIGGHPISGKEMLSIQNADPGIFIDTAFILTPLNRTSENTKDIAVRIVNILRARPVWLDAESHDRFLAFTSHLPYLVSSSLASITPQDAGPFIGPGFRSASRLAGTPSSMMGGVLETNRDFILEVLHGFQSHLSIIETALQNGNIDDLLPTLNSSQEKYLLMMRSPHTIE